MSTMNMSDASVKSVSDDAVMDALRNFPRITGIGGEPCDYVAVNMGATTECLSWPVAFELVRGVLEDSRALAAPGVVEDAMVERAARQLWFEYQRDHDPQPSMDEFWDGDGFHAGQARRILTAALSAGRV